MSKKILLVSSLALGLAASAAFANGGMPAPCPINTFTPGLIVGLQAGLIDTGWESVEGLNDFGRLIGANVDVSKDTGFGGRIYIGYDAYDWLGFELGYLHFFDKTDISATIVEDGEFFGGGNASIETQAFDFFAKLKSPTYHGLGLYAKAGMAYMISSDRQATASDSDGDSINLGNDDTVKEMEPAYGIGAVYYFPAMPNLSMDLSWTRYDSGHEKLDEQYLPNLDFYALGIAYKFNI